MGVVPHALLRFIAREGIGTLRRPSRLRKLLRPDRWAWWARYLTLRARVGERWEHVGGVARRRYESYDDYLTHQRAKLSDLDLAAYDQQFRRLLRERLPGEWRATSVLCLGARIGTEVKAFRDLGAFAVGVDLNPGPGNRLVLHGDFHDLQFADGSVDAVYSNSLDHAYDLDLVLAEVRRVLRPGGRLVLEIVDGQTEGSNPGFYEATAWTSSDDVVAAVLRHGFTAATRGRFDAPWGGIQVVFAA